MNRLYCILICLLLLAQISCKKNEHKTQIAPTPVGPINYVPPVTPVHPTLPPKKIDTIKPLSYLPVYPGSYWQYSNNTTYTTSAHYVKDAYSAYSTSGVLYQSDTFYVALYNNYPIWGYKKNTKGIVISYPGSVTQPFIRIISDSLPVGLGWEISYLSHGGESATIEAKDTTITIAGKNYYPTIVFSNGNSFQGGPITKISRSYYTKDIGLVKFEELSPLGSVTNEWHITDYFINK